MNSKLLKVCAAVMLIASAESVLCAGNEPKARFTSVSAEAKLEAKVKALIVVEFDQNQKTLSFVKDDGQVEKDKNNLTFSFNVKTAAVGYGLQFDPTHGATAENTEKGFTLVLHDQSDNTKTLSITPTLKDSKGDVVDFHTDQVLPFSKDTPLGNWSLAFKADLTNETPQGTYEGGIKITVVPLG